ncbi:tetratricopeptide repeat protein [Marilutibacter alkalisoli]|uniref:Tetratricopeptide repeat protein n=1 Tax=Marilutibacter alkalisoli TaxID=2591633 RepID=A0A514BMT6_9GAMM|nr:tetratricopeptide repeat protein [Lysobacter alkalisoli]QDH68681.1 tetratricopeptide repeat protein [Lysobacter alkalisoli]
MNASSPRHLTLLAAAMGVALALGSVSTDANAQRRGQASTSVAEYPEASRQEPGTRASAKMSSRLQKMIKAYEGDKYAEAIVMAEEIMADEKANEYDRAFAAQIAAQSAYNEDDFDTTMRYLEKAIEYNGLDNNGHYGAMYMLAQLQLQEEQYDKSVATLDRLFAETKSAKPEQLVIKGNALYRLDRYAEAAAVLEQAIASTDEPRNDWQQLLMATYFETGQTDKAEALAEKVAANTPDDKRSQMNLAATYLQGENFGKAAEVLEKLRAAGQLTEDRDYRQLYASYLNMDGKEAEAARVIKDGLDQGILENNFQNNHALAQAYYFSDQIAPAIAAYQKAAPMDEGGETYLNLAKILWQEDRIPEAKEAARQALSKGVKRPEEARQITALPGG